MRTRDVRGVGASQRAPASGSSHAGAGSRAHVGPFAVERPLAPPSGPSLGRLRAVAAVLATGTALLFPRSSATADGCADCAPPSAARLRAAAGPPWDEEGVGWTFGTDGGECRTSSTGGESRVEGYEIVWTGTGASWRCPFSQSGSTITVSVSDTDRFRWHVEGSVGLELGNELVGKLKTSLSGGTDEENVRVVSGGITKSIAAGWCHRVNWHAAFLAQKVVADVTVRLERRYAWWVKSTPWTSEIAASGTVWVPCGSATLTFKRLEPLYLSVSLADRKCPDCENVPTVPSTPWWPPLPGEFTPPAPFPPEPPDPAPAPGAPVTPSEPAPVDGRGDDAPLPPPPGGTDGTSPGGTLPPPPGTR
jgi:hypothetical protein